MHLIWKVHIVMGASKSSQRSKRIGKQGKAIVKAVQGAFDFSYPCWHLLPWSSNLSIVNMNRRRGFIIVTRALDAANIVTKKKKKKRNTEPGIRQQVCGSSLCA